MSNKIELNKPKQPPFIHLKEMVFAEYNIVYHINDCYSIKDIRKVNNKHQLLFQKFSNKIQQANLLLVDSLFPIHIADIALEVLLNRVSSFQDYIYLEKNFTVIDDEADVDYFKYKFNSFLHLLLYSNIATDQVCYGEEDTDNIYYLKDDSQEIKYYSILEHNKLKELLIEKIQLQINQDKSFISNDEVSLCFRIFFS